MFILSQNPLSLGFLRRVRAVDLENLRTLHIDHQLVSRTINMMIAQQTNLSTSENDFENFCAGVIASIPNLDEFAIEITTNMHPRNCYIVPDFNSPHPHFTANVMNGRAPVRALGSFSTMRRPRTFRFQITNLSETVLQGNFPTSLRGHCPPILGGRDLQSLYPVGEGPLSVIPCGDCCHH